MAAGAFTFNANAQQRIPQDQQTVVGKLENGMTYYVRHNSNPKGCADFYIAHNVGALQEEDNQNGLAHFLEHMAFNGTKHYPGKTLFDFLSKEGVRFGYNVNAYTSRYETVYNLSEIPLVRESFVDSVMLILHDWSCDISCEQDALDAERGVISEEWRRSDNQRSRMGAAQNALIYHGGKHTRRSVLGTMEIINGFKREEIIDFYKRWYRPDLQAIIAVGDFDTEEMVARIKRMFSDIPAVENPEQKEAYPVPTLEEPLFKNMLDPEIKFQALKVMHRLPYPGPGERDTEEFWKQHYVKQIISYIVAGRMQIAAKNSDSPVSSAVLVTNPSVADYYIAQFTLSAKKADLLEETLAFYCREIKRVLDHGFSKDEFEVAKFHVSKRNNLNNDIYDSDITNEMIVNICKEHFLRKRALASPSELHEIQKCVFEGIEYEETHAYLSSMFGESEQIFSYNIGEDKKNLIPSAERMKEIIAAIDTEVLEPKFMTYSKIDLDIDAPAGKVVKVKKAKEVGGEYWTLSNGAKVYWLPYEKVKSGTHLVMNVRFNTGYRTWPQDKIAEAKSAASYIGRNIGFGSYGMKEISDSPECGAIRASYQFEKEFAGISINAGADDAETGFKMVQNYLCRPYFDTEKNLGKFRTDNLRSLGRELGSTQLFNREKNTAKLGAHPWIDYVDSAAVSATDMNLVKEIYDRSFGNPEEMTVFICSDMDRETILGYVEKYLASYTGTGNRYEKSKNAAFIPSFKGEVVVDRTYPLLSAPKVDVQYEFHADIKQNAKNNVAFKVLDYIMSQRCVNQIREERGGTYHVRFYTEDLEYEGLRQCIVPFQTRPEMAEILIQDTEDLINDICENGPTELELENAVKYLIKAQGERRQRFANSLSSKSSERMAYILYGAPFDFDYDAVIKSLTVKDIQKLAKKVNNGKRFISVYREL